MRKLQRFFLVLLLTTLLLPGIGKGYPYRPHHHYTSPQYSEYSNHPYSPKAPPPITHSRSYNYHKSPPQTYGASAYMKSYPSYPPPTYSPPPPPPPSTYSRPQSRDYERYSPSRDHERYAVRDHERYPVRDHERYPPMSTRERERYQHLHSREPEVYSHPPRERYPHREREHESYSPRDDYEPPSYQPYAPPPPPPPSYPSSYYYPPAPPPASYDHNYFYKKMGKAADGEEKKEKGDVKKAVK